MAEVKRAVRVAERVRDEIARLLGRKINDPRVAGVIVSRVEMTDDLRMARVFYRLLEADVPERRLKEAQTGLERAAGLFRRELTHALKLRSAPELRFSYDSGMDHQNRVEELLAEIERDRRRD
ncbi:MAG TPA: 30S ribosome-binding factor RbfA [Polyangiaceae bacterium]|jgi:ribosome-binding factor A|nr:30S ribosome-binding factor RbfA [Polyangiaceae bacterium]